jgi:hypothetical protein
MPLGRIARSKSLLLKLGLFSRWLGVDVLPAVPFTWGHLAPGRAFATARASAAARALSAFTSASSFCTRDSSSAIASRLPLLIAFSTAWSRFSSSRFQNLGFRNCGFSDRIPCASKRSAAVRPRPSFIAVFSPSLSVRRGMGPSLFVFISPSRHVRRYCCPWTAGQDTGLQPVSGVKLHTATGISRSSLARYRRSHACAKGGTVKEGGETRESKGPYGMGYGWAPLAGKGSGRWRRNGEDQAGSTARVGQWHLATPREEVVN